MILVCKVRILLIMDLSKLTVKQLRLRCKKNQIKGYSKLRKQDLIELIVSMICPYCEKLIPISSEYCPKCDKPLVKKGFTKDEEIIEDEIDEIDESELSDDDKKALEKTKEIEDMSKDVIQA